MTHTSPTVELVWTVLSVSLWVFLLTHLWHFDRFRCLRFWESMKQNNGAFKKIMTFSYLLAIPLIFTRSFVMMWIKYKVGYQFIPGFGYIPTPWQLWPESLKRWIFPAQICFALAWSMEIVSHLEELCFWLFLTRVSPLHMSWFRSINCWIWVVGSAIGLIVMPLVAVLTRSDPLVNEAWIVFVGSIFSTVITVAFFRVIWIFPAFMRRVKTEGAGQEVVTRLQTFHSINLIRVAFRLLFCVSMLILSSDGIRPHVHPINENSLWADLLSVCAGLGCVISSALTLLIFFPRSMPREAGYGSRIQSRTTGNEKTPDKSFFNSPAPNSPVVHSENPFGSPEVSQARSQLVEYKNALWEIEENNALAQAETFRIPPLPPVRYPPQPQKKSTKKKRNTSNIHPLILNYSSPIDLMDDRDPLVVHTESGSRIQVV